MAQHELLHWVTPPPGTVGTLSAASGGGGAGGAPPCRAGGASSPRHARSLWPQQGLTKACSSHWPGAVRPPIEGAWQEPGWAGGHHGRPPLLPRSPWGAGRCPPLRPGPALPTWLSGCRGSSGAAGNRPPSLPQGGLTTGHSRPLPGFPIVCLGGRLPGWGPGPQGPPASWGPVVMPPSPAHDRGEDAAAHPLPSARCPESVSWLRLCPSCNTASVTAACARERGGGAGGGGLHLPVQLPPGAPTQPVGQRADGGGRRNYLE